MANNDGTGREVIVQGLPGPSSVAYDADGKSHKHQVEGGGGGQGKQMYQGSCKSLKHNADHVPERLNILFSCTGHRKIKYK